jgi:hypothetical protein
VSSTGKSSSPGRPDADELEISLFGPGYGEALAIHVGNASWILVDSCLDTRTGRPAALAYLEDIGVDYSRQVVLVLATHWHDDHVRGLAEVVRRCASARFAYSGALRTPEFFVLVESPGLGTERVTSGVQEFADILALLRERQAASGSSGGLLRIAVEEVNLHSSATCVIRALSPSEATIQQAMKAIADLIPEYKATHKRVSSPTPNLASVAVWVDGGTASALLGADLERDARDDKGWGAVLALQPAANGRAKLAKLPHHGSASGHDQRMWDQLLDQQPEAMLTPWNRGLKPLPTEDDRRRICELAPAAVIAGKGPSRPANYSPAVERTLREAGATRLTATGRTGHVRARSSPSDSGTWRIERVREAQPLCVAT